MTDDKIQGQEAEALPMGNLYAGLVLAQRAARGVGKGGQNKHHNYRYATSEQIIDEARHALSQGDLALMVVDHRVDFERTPAIVRVDYVLVHVSGEARQIGSITPIIPERGRPFDKALAAAKTFDLAYLLRTLLLLPRGDEYDVDARDDRARGQSSAAAQAPDGPKRSGSFPEGHEAKARKKIRAFYGALNKDDQRVLDAAGLAHGDVAVAKCIPDEWTKETLAADWMATRLAINELDKGG